MASAHIADQQLRFGAGSDRVVIVATLEGRVLLQIMDHATRANQVG